MLKRIWFLVRLLLLILVVLDMSCPCLSFASPKENELRIGILPEMNVFAQMNRFKPLANYLSKKVGIRVKLTMLSRYGNIVERLKTHDIDAAFLGSFTGALAISQLGVEVLARPVNLDGSSTYHGVLFVRKDSGITTVSDMKGKTLVMVERATTAGYIFPRAYFRKHGVTELLGFFKGKYFSGSHDAAIDAVLKGRAEVGAAKNTVYERMKLANPRIDQDLVILARSEVVPSNGLCVLPQVNAEIRTRLKETLLTMHADPDAIEVLKHLEALRFIETVKEDYKPVIEMVHDAGLNLRDYSYKNP